MLYWCILSGFSYFCTMIIIQNTVVSEELLEKHFVCNLSKCKGACCIEGDAGAPIEQEEIAYIAEHYNSIKPYLLPDSAADIEKRGFWEKDGEYGYVTTCQPTGECNFAYYDDQKVIKCGIEKAHAEGLIDFQKPISCHLYPIRIRQYPQFEMLNYDRWSICSPACALGEELKVPVYKFLKTPLIRKYGYEWFRELERIANPED
jgi:hypothetical protein